MARSAGDFCNRDVIIMRRFACLTLSLLVAGCATTKTATPYDPLERLNRAIWGVNMGLDKVAIKPASTVYRTITPRPARRGLSRMLSNLSEPFSAINALLQGKPDRAGNSLRRFIVNTTLGVGGLADHASEMGFKPTPEDFGQTLAVWGFKHSDYLVLPILGPSTIRDGIGSGVAQFGDPYRIGLRESGLTRTQRYGVVGFEAVSARADLIDSGADALLDSSADSYATARSAYLQRRAAMIADEDDGAPAPGKGSDDAALDAALKDIDANSGTATTPPAAAPAPDATKLDTPTPASPQ